MAIHFIEEDSKVKGLKRNLSRNWLHEVIEYEGRKPGVINFIFCSDTYLLEMNRQYLKHDYLTDVISFDYSEGGKVSGDVFISVDRVRENAVEMSVSFLDELYRVMVHGVLHLIGYDDATADLRANMSRLEDLYLAKVRESTN
jgi:rRNA maturation RNase YbeY